MTGATTAQPAQEAPLLWGMATWTVTYLIILFLTAVAVTRLLGWPLTSAFTASVAGWMVWQSTMGLPDNEVTRQMAVNVPLMLCLVAIALLALAAGPLAAAVLTFAVVFGLESAMVRGRDRGYGLRNIDQGYLQFLAIAASASPPALPTLATTAIVLALAFVMRIVLPKAAILPVKARGVGERVVTSNPRTAAERTIIAAAMAVAAALCVLYTSTQATWIMLFAAFILATGVDASPRRIREGALGLLLGIVIVTLVGQLGLDGTTRFILAHVALLVAIAVMARSLTWYYAFFSVYLTLPMAGEGQLFWLFQQRFMAGLIGVALSLVALWLMSRLAARSLPA